MSNMSYCRFQNTLGDLDDCYENMDAIGKDTSEEELAARLHLIALCKNIADEYADEIEG